MRMVVEGDGGGVLLRRSGTASNRSMASTRTELAPMQHLHIGNNGGGSNMVMRLGVERRKYHAETRARVV